MKMCKFTNGFSTGNIVIIYGKDPNFNSHENLIQCKYYIKTMYTVYHLGVKISLRSYHETQRESRPVERQKTELMLGQVNSTCVIY